MLHWSFRHTNMTPGIKDLELCPASTYFAIQSALLHQSKKSKVKSDSNAMVPIDAKYDLHYSILIN